MGSMIVLVFALPFLIAWAALDGSINFITASLSIQNWTDMFNELKDILFQDLNRQFAELFNLIMSERNLG